MRWSSILKTSVGLASVGLAIMAVPSGPALAGSFTYQTIDPPGAVQTSIQTIASSSIVSGTFRDAAGLEHGFIWSHGAYTVLDGKIAGKQIEAVAVNAKGQVSFATYSPKGAHADTFVRSAAGHVLPVRIPGAVISFPYVIGRQGEVLGVYQTQLGAGVSNGFVYSGGTVQTLNAPGATSTFLTSINNHGVVAGDDYSLALGFHGFIYQNGAFQTIDPPNSFLTEIYSINDAGLVSGVFFIDRNGVYNKGFIYSHGHYKILVPPGVGAVSTEAVFAVDDHDVTGDWYDLQQEHVFHFLGGAYYRVDPPRAIGAVVTAGLPDGTFVGNYWDAKDVSHGYIATCPAGQAPCTG